MRKNFYKASMLLFTFLFLVPFSIGVKAETADFSDVKADHWAYEYIMELRNLGVTDGIGNNQFGLGKNITRAEFVAFLCKLMNWQVVENSASHFTDTGNSSNWYYNYVETALQNGAITTEQKTFRPTNFITREEMAVMIVRALGYDVLANQITNLGSPFPDVKNNMGYITIAKDCGIISGISESQFAGSQTATREQAAKMMIKMVRLTNNKINWLNGFYAIRSANQMAMINNLNSVSFGWARLELNDTTLSFNTTPTNSNEYNIPDGFEDPYHISDGKVKLLLVNVKDADASKIINDDNLRNQAVNVMASGITSTSKNDTILQFDGIVVDFESLKGEQSKNNYNIFLTKLKEELNKNGKQMYVAVHPQRRTGHEFYDGYDYKTIGNLADKVILMAHDYNAKTLTQQEMEQGIVMTPVAPIEEVYYALRAITDKNTGVSDASKIMLQLSFSTAQWKIKDGKVMNQTPYTPDMETVAAKIKSIGETKYVQKYESPYITFYNEADSTNNVVWYEDNRSVAAKIKLAELFGVSNISLWRLGNIPDLGNTIFVNK